MTSAGGTLTKSERLSGKKSVSALLAGGRWGAYGHFRYCWRATSCHSEQSEGICSVPPGRILVSVPKRFFKRAVKRNLLKRRIREAYRVRKVKGVDILFQYNSKEIADFVEICADVEAILSRIGKALEADGGEAISGAFSAEEKLALPSAGRKTPENLPEQAENMVAGRKTPENLPAR